MVDTNKRKSTADEAAELLKTLKRVQESAVHTAASSKETFDQLTLFGRAVKRGADTLSWIRDKVLVPVGTVLPFLKPLARAIGRQYSWYCYPSEPFFPAVKRALSNSFGKAAQPVANLFRAEKAGFTPSVLPRGQFSKSRAGIATLVTAFALSPVGEVVPFVGPFIPDVISDHAAALVYEPPYDVVRMGMSALFNGGALKHEKIYLNGKNEIDPKNDVWSANGCEDAPGCSPEDAITFHIKPSLMHQAWSFATGRGPFLPDYVAAAIPNVPSQCDVVSYAPRWRVSKWINSYPMLLDVKCDPLAMREAPKAP